MASSFILVKSMPQLGSHCRQRRFHVSTTETRCPPYSQHVTPCPDKDSSAGPVSATCCAKINHEQKMPPLSRCDMSMLPLPPASHGPRQYTSRTARRYQLCASSHEMLPTSHTPPQDDMAPPTLRVDKHGRNARQRHAMPLPPRWRASPQLQALNIYTWLTKARSWPKAGL